MTDDDAIEVRKLRSQWYCLFMAWQVLHWIGIITISAGSAIVASKWAATPNARDGIALAVAITSAVYAVLEPAQRANSYRQAWVGMNLAYFKDKNLPATTFEAIKQGEEIIGHQAAPKGTH